MLNSFSFAICLGEDDGARAYSLDLRRRVVKAIDGCMSSREAARRFAVGIATAGSWHRLWRKTGDVRPGRQGQPKRSKLDAHEDFILGLVAATKDITLAEIAELLSEKRGFTFKKRQRTRASNSART